MATKDFVETKVKIHKEKTKAYKKKTREKKNQKYFKRPLLEMINFCFSWSKLALFGKIFYITRQKD